MQCTNNPFERAIDVCDECGLPFSREFLVFPNGRPSSAVLQGVCDCDEWCAARGTPAAHAEEGSQASARRGACCALRRSPRDVWHVRSRSRTSRRSTRPSATSRLPAHPANARSSGASDAARSPSEPERARGDVTSHDHPRPVAAHRPPGTPALRAPRSGPKPLAGDREHPSAAVVSRPLAPGRPRRSRPSRRPSPAASSSPRSRRPARGAIG